MLNELRDLDFNDIGSAPASVRYVILGFLLAIILAIGYFLLIKDKVQQLEMVQNLENSLRAEFEQKQSKAANLENYEAQLAEMQELLETMFRQLPSKTEMDKLLVDVSQTALGSGIDVQLFHEVNNVSLRLRLALLCRLFLTHDIEFPAGQLARKADILPATPDRLRQLVLFHGDVHAVGILVDDNGNHLCRRHGVNHELGRVLVP